MCGRYRLTAKERHLRHFGLKAIIAGCRGLNRFVTATGIEYGKYVGTSRGSIQPSPL